MKKLYVWIILLLISCVAIWYHVDQIPIRNEGRDYWELKLTQWVHGEDFYFGSYEKGWHRPVDLIIDDSLSIRDDQIKALLKNASFSSFYGLTFDQEFPRLYLNVLEYRAAQTDTISPNLYTCGTGLFFRKIERGTILSDSIFNPYRDYLYHLQMLDTRKTMPDSVDIQIGILAASLPWSMYRSEVIYSNTIRKRREEMVRDMGELNE